ncbi:hypothetical protein Lal_00018498 [Lupinus albus]|nr:hypothetical protein Lal_00018498 [Lupinus albus]
MSEARPKRLKNSANRASHQPRRVRNRVGGVGQNALFGVDPFSLLLFKPKGWQNFLALQGAGIFLELNIYPTLVREFYTKFH